MNIDNFFLHITKRISLAISICLVIVSPVLAISDQRENIERYPFYDESAEVGCAIQSSGGADGKTSLYFIGDSIGEGMVTAGLETTLSAKNITANINVDPGRSITGKGLTEKTSGIEAIQADIDIIQGSDIVAIELGTNTEPDFATNLQNIVNIINGANPDVTIYFMDVGVSEEKAALVNGAQTNSAIYDQASKEGTNVISRFNLHYPNGDAKIYTGLGNPAVGFASDGIHEEPAGYQALSDLFAATIGLSLSTSSSSCTCPTSSVIPADTTLTGDNNKQIALNYFISKGFTPQQSAGILGNLMAESGVNPKRVQSTPTPSGDRDTITVDNKTGYGIAQWTSRGRQQGLVDFANSRGMTIQGDIGLQLDYLMKELTGGYRSVYDAILRAPDLRSASDVFMTKFERPADQSEGAKQKRASFGQQILDLYGGGVGGATPLPANINCSPTSTTPVAGGISGSFVGFPLQTTKARMTQLNGGQFKNGIMSQGGHPYAAHDIMADPGTPVLAILAGRVVGVSTDKCPGRLISVYNDQIGVTVAYLHLSIANTIVKVGDTITEGQIIGYVGVPSEGCGTPHLHIDANTTNRRIGCKRESCPAANQALFQAGSDKIQLPKGLYDSYMKLP